MKLMDVRYGKKFKLKQPEVAVSVHPAAPPPDYTATYKMGRLAGMYYYCWRESDGLRCYFTAWTEVELCD